MNVSPYIEQSLKNPAKKIFFSQEDIIYDRRLTPRDKILLLQLIDQAEHGLVHISRN